MHNQLKCFHQKLFYLPSVNPINKMYITNAHIKKSESILVKHPKDNCTTMKHSADLIKTNSTDSFQYKPNRSSYIDVTKGNSQGSHIKLSKNKSCVLIKDTNKSNTILPPQRMNVAFIQKKRTIRYNERINLQQRSQKQLKKIKNCNGKRFLSLSLTSKKPKKAISLHAYEKEKKRFTTLLFNQHVDFTRKKFFLETFLQKMANPHFIDGLFNAKISS